MKVLKKFNYDDESKLYVASAGQTRVPFQENEGVPFAEYEKPAMPDPPLAQLELTDEAKALGYEVPSQRQHFLPGLTAEMLDWFWANMEKGYYLWAPGSHKRFNWIRSPYEYGFEDSVHIIVETTDPALPAFGGEGVQNYSDLFDLMMSLVRLPDLMIFIRSRLLLNTLYARAFSTILASWWTRLSTSGRMSRAGSFTSPQLSRTLRHRCLRDLFLIF